MNIAPERENMNKKSGLKLVVVGGVAGGMSVAARVRRIDENAEIKVFERGRDVSYSNCCLPYHLNGMISDCEDLILMNPAVFAKNYNLDVHTYHEVQSIDRKHKTVHVKNLETGEEFDEKYDKLALSPGAEVFIPQNIKGIEAENVFIVQNVVEIDKLQSYLEEKSIKDVVIVGGGFIGMEVGEALIQAGKNVHMVEMMKQVLSPLDYDMVQQVHKELYDNGMKLYLEEEVVEIRPDKVILKSGKEIAAGAVVMGTGVKPRTELAEKAGLEIGETGGIKVNQHYQTSDRDIYAVGDAVEVTHRITRKKVLLPLAGPAQKQARAAADHIYGMQHNNKGIIGSSCIHVFGLNVAMTGINARECEKAGIDYDYVYVIPQDKVGLMPQSNPLFFKLIYELPTGRILGAQAIGKGDSIRRVDVIAAMISMNGTIEDLKELELCYSPYYGTAKDVVNHAALVATNLLYGRFKQVHVNEVRDLVESGACIIDVREKPEWERGHIKTAKNIPMSEFRKRLDEIPKDEPVYLHCRSSQRSYNVLMALQGLGYDNVCNISGSFLGICIHEYFLDETTDREPIVTEYNFN